MGVLGRGTHRQVAEESLSVSLTATEQLIKCGGWESREARSLTSHKNVSNAEDISVVRVRVVRRMKGGF